MTLKWLTDNEGEEHTYVEIDDIQCRIGFSFELQLLALCILDFEPSEEQHSILLELNKAFSVWRVSASLDEGKILLIMREVEDKTDENLHNLLEVAKRCIAELASA